MNIANPEEVAKISYASRIILPTLRTELPPTLVTMVAVLAGFGSAWLVEDLARLHTDLVVLAVVLAVTLGRTQRSSDLRDRLTGAAVLPPAAAAAGGVGLLSDHHTVAGDTLFALAVAAAIWVRRFGPRFARAGTQATLPFIAILVTPVPPDSGATHLLWAALMAVIAVGWVTVVQVAAQRAGRCAKPPNQSFTTPTPSSAARIRASTRMAVQMGVALGVAFWVGHRLFPDHWAWTVLTAYIVASGNRGRGDVVHKGALRIAGAAVGTVIATLLAGTFPAGDKWAVVVIFAILALATWLRPLSYAYGLAASRRRPRSSTATSARVGPTCCAPAWRASPAARSSHWPWPGGSCRSNPETCCAAESPTPWRLSPTTSPPPRPRRAPPPPGPLRPGPHPTGPGGRTVENPSFPGDQGEPPLRISPRRRRPRPAPLPRPDLHPHRH